MAKPKLNDSDSKLLETLLAEYATIENDKLAPVQRVIINLNSIENKTADNFKSLRAMLKIERDRLDNAKMIADVLAQQEKAKLDAQENFTREFFNAVESKVVINGLSSSMTAKQLIQRLIDEKIVSSNKSLKQFLNSIVENEKSDSIIENEIEAVKDKNDNADASSVAIQAYSVHDAVVVPDEN